MDVDVRNKYEYGENCTMFSIFCTCCQISLGDKIRKEEIYVACNTNEREER